MDNRFGPAPTVTSKNGTVVAAKWLQDDLGNYIIDPSTSKPYLVPAYFNLNTFIDKYSAMGSFPGPAALVQTRLEFLNNFQAGHVDDLQRSYNGVVGGDFVDAFRPAASFVFGVAAKAAGLYEIEPLFFGGAYNWLKSFSYPSINTSGIYGNNPPNDINIHQGAIFFDYLAQGVHTGLPPVYVSESTKTYANFYVNSLQSNIASGKAPDGSPIGVMIGSASNGGSLIWTKDSATGAFTLVSYTDTPTGYITSEIQFSASGAATGVKTSTQNITGATVVYTSGSLANQVVTNSTIFRDPDVSVSANSYIVKKGDTIDGLARDWGVTREDVLNANPQITNKNLI